MCDPITAIGAALTAGSIFSNYQANQQVQNKRNDAMAAERIRQRQFDQEASAVNNKSRDRYNDFSGQQGDKAGGLKDYYAKVTSQVTAPAPTEAPVATKTGGVVAQETAKQKAKSGSFIDQQNSAFADQNSFGSLFGDISRLQARDGATIGQLAGFKKGSANVLPYELQAANAAGNDMKLLGDILGGLGSIGVKAGLGGANLGGITNLFSPSTGYDLGTQGFVPGADEWIASPVYGAYSTAY